MLISLLFSCRRSFLIFAVVPLALATPPAVDQARALRQYAGEWVSTASVDSVEVGDRPAIRMSSRPVMGGRTLAVEVQQWRGEGYVTLLTELISHDATTGRIVAFGQNEAGVCFRGEGAFLDEASWEMSDVDMVGEHYLDVRFRFRDSTDVMVEGFDAAGNSQWQTRYLKANPQDKNIGVQLVSVHAAMLDDPRGTLQRLGRMGYSFVETFVYEDGCFYGMEPAVFRDEVEAAGMRLAGSMVVVNAPPPDDWSRREAWWARCVEDHVAAGVDYLTVSHHGWPGVTRRTEVRAVAEFYNALGRLCASRGITLAYHNHADEFREVEGTLIYDELLAHTDPKWVRLQADIYWMVVGGVEPWAYAATHGERFWSWHVKDYGELGDSGKIDWARLFHADEVPLPPYLVAEVEDHEVAPLLSVDLAWQVMYYDFLAER